MDVCIIFRQKFISILRHQLCYFTKITRMNVSKTKKSTCDTKQSKPLGFRITHFMYLWLMRSFSDCASWRKKIKNEGMRIETKKQIITEDI